MQNRGPLFVIGMLALLGLASYLSVFLLKNIPSFNLDLRPGPLNFSILNFFNRQTYYPLANGSIFLIFLAAGVVGWTLVALRGQASWSSLFYVFLLALSLWLLYVLLVPSLFR